MPPRSPAPTAQREPCTSLLHHCGGAPKDCTRLLCLSWSDVSRKLSVSTHVPIASRVKSAPPTAAPEVFHDLSQAHLSPVLSDAAKSNPRGPLRAPRPSMPLRSPTTPFCHLVLGQMPPRVSRPAFSGRWLLSTTRNCADSGKEHPGSKALCLLCLLPSHVITRCWYLGGCTFRAPRSPFCSAPRASLLSPKLPATSARADDGAHTFPPFSLPVF